MDNPLVINDLGRGPMPPGTAGAGVLGVSEPLASVSTASRRPSRLPTTVKLGFKMRPGWKVLSSTAAIGLPGAGGRVRAKTREDLFSALKVPPTFLKPPMMLKPVLTQQP